jgi:hypothetical protein
VGIWDVSVKVGVFRPIELTSSELLAVLGAANESWRGIISTFKVSSPQGFVGLLNDICPILCENY